MSPSTLLVLILPASTLASGVAGGAAAQLLRAASVRTHTQTILSGLRYSAQDPAARTLLTLDKNRDGRIDPSEVEAFAKQQGLDAASATQEFSSIDQNGDGVLDSQELMQVLGTDAAPAAGAVEAAAPAIVPTASHTQHAVGAASVAPAKPHSSAPEEAAFTSREAAQKETAPKQAASEETLPDATFMGSEATRAAVRSAAADVAEQLFYEEEEEKAARSLDRKAAEIRANSTALAKLTVQDALDAGAVAAHQKAVELLAEITQLEEQAAKAEVRAAALTAKSKLEAEQARDLMSVADSALKPASSD